MKTYFNKISAEEVVEKQLAAYNNGDYDLFASYYHSNITSYEMETGRQNPLMSGMNFFAHYRKKFLEHSKIHCKVVGRLIHNNLVIDQEVITNWGERSLSGLVIYLVEAGKVSKMWFSKTEKDAVLAVSNNGSFS